MMLMRIRVKEWVPSKIWWNSICLYRTRLGRISHTLSGAPCLIIGIVVDEDPGYVLRDDYLVLATVEEVSAPMLTA